MSKMKELWAEQKQQAELAMHGSVPPGHVLVQEIDLQALEVFHSIHELINIMELNGHYG